SLKALCCIEGRDLLYERCARLGILHRRLGKLIVAAEPAELDALEQIRARAVANGAGGIELLDAHEVRAPEPRVGGVGAVWSPNSGIGDAPALADSFQAELETAGGQVVFRPEVLGLEPAGGVWRIQTRGPDGERFSVEVGSVVNAAGLESDRVA